MKSTIHKHIEKHLRGLQFLIQTRFGANAPEASGECTVFIGPKRIKLTNGQGTIIARGPARVATVLVRKRKRAAK